jgi:hypothetical protein
VINKITRGDHQLGLVRYLFSEQDKAGRRNEHTNPRLVAADGSVQEPVGEPLSADQRRNLAETLDAPHAMYGVDVPQGYSWHVSFSTKGGVDRDLSDGEWAEIATAAMERLGFTEAPGRAACRWAAVHHGKSLAGNDHIHIAVDLVREDGRVANVWRDRVVLSEFCTEMENRYGLAVIEGRAKGAMPAFKQASVSRAERAGRSEPEEVTLARQVRAAASMSRSEDEFVRRLREGGVAVLPRYARGGTDHVVGYSVAVKPGEGQQFLWNKGGGLAADLALPRLRERWGTTPEGQAEAVGEWGPQGHFGRGRDGYHRRGRLSPDEREARGRTRMSEWETVDGLWGGRRVPARSDGRERAQYSPEEWSEAASRVGQVVRDLATVPVDDVAGWQAAAAGASGVLAAMSARLEDRPGPIARAADVMARSAQRPQHDGRDRLPVIRPSGVMRTVAAVMAQAEITDEAAVGWQLMLREMLALARALELAHRARGELQQAGRLTDQVRVELVDIHARIGAASHVGELYPHLVEELREAAERSDSDRGDDGGGDGRRRRDKPTAGMRPSDFAAVAARRAAQERDAARGLGR